MVTLSPSMVAWASRPTSGGQSPAEDGATIPQAAVATATATASRAMVGRSARRNNPASASTTDTPIAAATGARRPSLSSGA
jgi:hypothetical protein